MSFSNESGTTMLVQPAYGGGGGFGFGGDNAWWIILFLIFGWGNNGWGNGGMNGGVGSEVQRGFDHSSTITKLDGITQGLCDGFYAQNTGMMNGFHGVDSAICNLGYQTQSGFNALGAQLAQCCCDTREAIAGVRYDMATQACDTRHAIATSTRDIIDNQNANSRALMDFLVQDKIATLQSENQNLKLAASQANQNAVLMAAMDANKAELLRRTGHDCPTAAYIVQPPTPVSFNACGTGYTGYGCGCGC